MTSNYILSDLISRLNVASKNRLRSIKVLNTKLSRNVLCILYKNGLIIRFFIELEYIYVFLKYHQNECVCNLKVISKPSKRVYVNLHKLSLLYNNNSFSGFYILSTSKGLITSNDCLLFKHKGGELLLKVGF